MANEDQAATEQLEAAMNKPKQVTVDGVTAQAHSLPELVAADKYLQQKKALKKRGFFSFRKMIPPGTVG